MSRAHENAHPWLALVAVAAALATGCTNDPGSVEEADTDTDTNDGSEGDDSGGTGEPSATEMAVASLATTQCSFIDSCACDNEVAQGDVESCEDAMTLKWQDRLDVGLSRELTLDMACLDSTLARMQAQECRWPVSSIGHVCESFCAVYHGDLPLGSACTAHDAQVSDCAQGLACVGGSCAEPCNVLTGLQIGDTCRNEEFGQPFDDCASGLSCDWDTAACFQAARVGESCQNTQCADELFCDWQSDQCRAPATEGQTCNEFPCADPLFCDWDANVCRSRAKIGESCLGVPCEEDSSCGPADLCIARPGIGESCQSGPCAEGVLCDWNTERCVAPPQADSPCLFGQCADETWCDFSNPDNPDGMCRGLVAYGEACSGHSQCDSNYCPAGFCLDRPKLGEDCSGTLVCGKGLVCDGATCIATRTRGPAACVYEGW